VAETSNGVSLEKASALLRGTEGSKPAPSSAESAANLTFGGALPGRECSSSFSAVRLRGGQLKGCWNWWGYAGDKQFLAKQGVQVGAIWQQQQKAELLALGRLDVHRCEPADPERAPDSIPRSAVALQNLGPAWRLMCEAAHKRAPRGLIFCLGSVDMCAAWRSEYPRLGSAVTGTPSSEESVGNLTTMPDCRSAAASSGAILFVLSSLARLA
jgi:hypothetical protein